MTEMQEGDLCFKFDDDVTASKYDDWSFYRNQFQNGCACANKAADLLCKADATAWLIEVKDYRHHARTKPGDLADEIAIKVRDTLAGLVAAQFQAADAVERRFARQLLRAQRLRVVCHLEQPAKVSRLRPRAIQPADLKDQLRRILKAVDPHPIVMDRDGVPQGVPWRVE